MTTNIEVVREGTQFILLKTAMSFFPKKMPELYLINRLNGIGTRAKAIHIQLSPEELKFFIRKEQMKNDEIAVITHICVMAVLIFASENMPLPK